MESQPQASSGISLGKGAWDCDARVAIPPEKEVLNRTMANHIDCCFIDDSLATKLPFGFYCWICQAEVFEEIATMEFPFEGIPTVPPRKDMDHMASILKRSESVISNLVKHLL